MKIIKLISILLFFFAFLSCKKNKDNIPAINVASGGKDTVYKFECKDIGMGSSVGWQDINMYTDSSVTCFFYNPQDPNEVIYLALGLPSHGYHSIWSYNLSTKVRKFLDAGLMYLPQINKKGWLVYEKLDFNIYKIKCNGDSLSKIANEGEDPKWDYTGNFIYYYRAGNPNKTYKITTSGLKIDSLQSYVFFAAFGKKGNICAYSRIINGVDGITLRNLATNEERRLFSKTSPAYYDDYNHLTFDNFDQNLYWWNQRGVYKSDLQGNVDTIIKSCTLMCPSYNFYQSYISPGVNKLTFTYEVKIPLNAIQLYHKYKAFEIDLYSGKMKEVKLF